MNTSFFPQKNVCCCLCCLCALLGGWFGAERSARAADTTEIWAQGELEADLLLSYAGLGLAREERGLGAELLLGYGLFSWLSLHGGVAMEADELFESGEVWPYAGAMTTPLDTDHLDLDLILEIGTSAAHPGELELWPGIELNLDRAPDRAGYGVYLRLALPVGIYLGDNHVPEENGRAALAALRLDATLGAYLTLSPGHQLLLEGGAIALLHHAGGDPTAVEGASAYLGYNVELPGGLEWVTQVGLELAAEGGWRPGAAVQSGFLLVVE